MRTAPPGYYYDARAAAHAVEFFRRYLRNTLDHFMGRPFEPLLWQEALLRVLFGWRRPNGRRRFRRFYLRIGRKNGKTEFAAGLALYLAFADGVAGAEVYCAATDKKTARRCYKAAADMRLMSPQLRQRSIARADHVIIGSTRSVLRLLASDASKQEGLNASAFVYDEVHAAKTRELHDTLQTSMVMRLEPLEILITTAGVDKASFCGEEDEYAESIWDGRIPDPHYLPALFGAGKEDDYLDPKVWARANPSLGKTFEVERIEEEALKAHRRPAYRNAFKRYHLDVWVEQESLWLPLDKWDLCNHGPVKLEQLAGRRCYGAVDLSSTTDLTALCLASPRPESPIIDVWWKFWLPKNGIEDKVRADRVPYTLWAEQGWLELTDGDVVDYGAVRLLLTGVGLRADGLEGRIEGRAAIRDQVDLAEIAFDRWGARGLMAQLAGDGLVVFEHGQGYASMSAPAKELEKRVIETTLNHGGNPIARWMAGIVTVVQDPAENIKPVKPDRKKGAKRIDGIVAAVMAVGRAAQLGAGGKSFWDKPAAAPAPPAQ